MIIQFHSTSNVADLCDIQQMLAYEIVETTLAPWNQEVQNGLHSIWLYSVPDLPALLSVPSPNACSLLHALSHLSSSLNRPVSGAQRKDPNLATAGSLQIISSL